MYAASLKPTAKEIMSAMKAADSPLDFITKNLGSAVATPQQQALPAETIKKVEEIRAVEAPKQDVKVEEPKVNEPKIPAAIEPKPTTNAAAPDTQPAQSVQPEPVDEDALLQTDKDINFKNLRTKIKETTSVLKTKEKELEEVTNKLHKYETGEEIPEPLKQKEARIQELEKYERLHALKLSPAYREAFIKPIEVAKSKLAEIAADYEIPNEVISKAIGFTNRRDLNQFLSEHFDEVGASEVKQAINSIQEIQTKAQEAEKEPAQALAAIEEDFKNVQAQRRAQANNKIVATTKDAWADSLYKIRQEGRVKELISKENDPEYNKTFVEPVLQACSTEYARIVKGLADNGLNDLPSDLAFALARMTQLAHSTVVANEARDRAEREAAELRSSAERTTKYSRPTVGAFNGTGATPASPTPTTPKEAGQMILDKVMSRR